MEQYARMKCQKGKSELIAAIEESYLDAHGTQMYVILFFCKHQHELNT